jgi:uncharacterized glyoxalase superfamily protein PhnB
MRRDPLDALRTPAAPLAPRPEFAATLRARLERELGISPPPTQIATAVTPYLAVSDARAALQFYRDAFGAHEDSSARVEMDDGRVGHAQFSIGNAEFMISDEYPEIGVSSPQTLGGSAVSLHLQIPDVDSTYAQALAAGATGEREPADQFHGNRNAVVRDPFGHRWMLSTPMHPETTRVGELFYFSFGVGDMDRARAFFGALLGWRLQDGHIGNIATPGGLYANDEPTIDLWFVVDDINAAVEKVRELGGSADEPVLYSSGWSATCDDGQGTRFGLSVPRPGY